MRAQVQAASTAPHSRFETGSPSPDLPLRPAFGPPQISLSPAALVPVAVGSAKQRPTNAPYFPTRLLCCHQSVAGVPAQQTVLLFPLPSLDEVRALLAILLHQIVAPRYSTSRAEGAARVLLPLSTSVFVRNRCPLLQR